MYSIGKLLEDVVKSKCASSWCISKDRGVCGTIELGGYHPYEPMLINSGKILFN